MSRTVSAAIGGVLVLASASTVLAKGITALITLESPGLRAPIHLRSPSVEQFHVWAGPGTRLNGIEATEGFVVDWASQVEPAQVDRLERYQVSFYVKQWNRLSQAYGEERLAYIVSYAYDAASSRGYVYVPGARDVEHRLNASSIHRGPRWQGRWFHATPEWDEVVKPLLADAP